LLLFSTTTSFFPSTGYLRVMLLRSHLSSAEANVSVNAIESNVNVTPEVDPSETTALAGTSTPVVVFLSTTAASATKAWML